MLARISELANASQAHSANPTYSIAGYSKGLGQLTSRDLDDPSIAILDSWSLIADVLSFYQERFQNEAYLRTAIERRSIQQLASLVGYNLRPGLSSSVYLAFTVDENASQVLIPAGTQAKSTPAPDSTATSQTFETSEDFIARPLWNSIRPMQSVPHDLRSPRGLGRLYLNGTGLRISSGDVIGIQRVALNEPVLRTVRHSFEVNEPSRQLTVIDLEPSSSDSRTLVDEVSILVEHYFGSLTRDSTGLGVATRFFNDESLLKTRQYLKSELDKARDFQTFGNYASVDAAMTQLASEVVDPTSKFRIEMENVASEFTNATKRLATQGDDSLIGKYVTKIKAHHDSLVFGNEPIGDWDDDPSIRIERLLKASEFEGFGQVITWIDGALDSRIGGFDSSRFKVKGESRHILLSVRTSPLVIDNETKAWVYEHDPNDPNTRNWLTDVNGNAAKYLVSEIQNSDAKSAIESVVGTLRIENSPDFGVLLVDLFEAVGHPGDASPNEGNFDRIGCLVCTIGSLQDSIIAEQKPIDVLFAANTDFDFRKCLKPTGYLCKIRIRIRDKASATLVSDSGWYEISGRDFVVSPENSSARQIRRLVNEELSRLEIQFGPSPQIADFEIFRTSRNAPDRLVGALKRLLVPLSSSSPLLLNKLAESATKEKWDNLVEFAKICKNLTSLDYLDSANQKEFVASTSSALKSISNNASLKKQFETHLFPYQLEDLASDLQQELNKLPREIRSEFQIRRDDSFQTIIKTLTDLEEKLKAVGSQETVFDRLSMEIAGLLVGDKVLANGQWNNLQLRSRLGTEAKLLSISSFEDLVKSSDESDFIEKLATLLSIADANNPADLETQRLSEVALVFEASLADFVSQVPSSEIVKAIDAIATTPEESSVKAILFDFVDEHPVIRPSSEIVQAISIMEEKKKKLLVLLRAFNSVKSSKIRELNRTNLATFFPDETSEVFNDKNKAIQEKINSNEPIEVDDLEQSDLANACSLLVEAYESGATDDSSVLQQLSEKGVVQWQSSTSSSDAGDLGAILRSMEELRIGGNASGTISIGSLISQNEDSSEVTNLFSQIQSLLGSNDQAAFFDRLRRLRLLGLEKPRIFVYRTSAKVFGWNAQGKIVETVGASGEVVRTEEPKLDEDSSVVFVDGEVKQTAPGDFLALSSEYESAEERRTIRVTSVTKGPMTKYGVSGMCTRLSLESEWWDSNPNFSSLRATSVFCDPEDLELSEVQLDLEKTATRNPRVSTSRLLGQRLETGKWIELDTVHPELSVGSAILLTGKREENDVNDSGLAEDRQLFQIDAINHRFFEKETYEPVGKLGGRLVHYGERGRTVLTLNREIGSNLLRKTVEIYANLVEATHGGRIAEVNGDGDGRKTFQSFSLKDGPLSRVPDSNEYGHRDELEVRVNQVKWGQKERISNASFDETSFELVSTLNESHGIRFGDGRNAARLPSGDENVRSTYRVGLGIKGNVARDRIDQLPAPPFGLKAVRNPIRASGGMDRLCCNVFRDR